MSSEAIRALLDTRLAAAVATVSPAPAIQRPNVKATATITAGYVRATLIPAQPEQATLGENGLNLEQGLYVVDCFYPTGVGPGVAMAAATTISNYFKRGTRIAGSGFTLVVRSSGVRQPTEEPERYKVPVQIEWYTFTPPPA